MNIVQVSLILSGFTLLVLGIRLFTWKPVPTPEPIPPVVDESEGKGEVIVITGTTTTPEPPSLPKKTENPNWVCGREFEAYVIGKLQEKKRWFQVFNQRSDQCLPNGEPLLDNRNPDLEVEAILGTTKEKIAVECKYRSNWYNDCIEWCEVHNLENYRNFSDERKMPVFVVLGVGGTCSSPQEMFCFKLTSGTSTKVTKRDMQSLKQSQYSGFYYDFKLQELLYKGLKHGS